MNDGDLEQRYAALEVQPGVTLEELERAYLKKNFSLLKGRSGSATESNPSLEADRRILRDHYDRLADHLRAQQRNGDSAAARRKPQLPAMFAPRPEGVTRPPMPFAPLPAAPAPASAAARREAEEFAPLAFDNWAVNTFAPPALLLLVFLANLSPLKFLLTGFHVWMHEFGHATAAWMCGFRATPLPIGWTPVEPVYSHFVYFGLLLMFALLFLAGLKERKVWPMIAAVALAALQYHMTWRMSELQQEFWWGAFGGVGGEFYLSTLFMLSFWVQLPDKFKWGACRYVFFLIGATAFLHIWWHWRDVYRGLEEIPFGSMINGEEDEGGDMNKLMDGFGWKKFDIRRSYWVLGGWCWAALGVMWLVFALRLNKAADWVAGRFMRPVEEAQAGES